MLRRTKEVTTRKMHECWGCCKTFPAGTKMQATTETDGPTILTVYWCAKCLDIMSDYQEDDLIGRGELAGIEEEQ
jgi:hypothetical protein